ncbi:quinon protein alcohol dehydrogenase-like superfamily [Cladochytrium replicatum]|nr:quinon protein alcohol dehydrogenase-like superfamily [Cladochytrium replicatum]
MELHRCRFVDYMPSGIVALAFSPQTYTPTFSYLACVRENGDIEIYNPRPPAATSRGFFLEKSIPGGPSASTECIAWTHQTHLTPYPDPSDPTDPNGEEARLAGVPPRLFSAGLDGLINEWDMNTLRPKSTVESNGGSVWCMAVNHIHTRLAVGCEDGCIRIFNVADGSLVYLRSFWRQEGRILSIAWDPTGRYIYSGSSDSSVRRFDSHSGLCIDRFTVGSTQTIVWTIAALADGTVLRQSQKAHAADILCMISNAAGNVVFTAGVDRQIVQFKYTVLSHSTGPALSGPSVKASDLPHLNRWIMTAQKRYHSHDVRALALLEGRPVDSLVSGGVDTQLTISQPASEFPIVSHIRLPPFPLQPLVSVSRGARAVMCRYPDRVKVWKVGTGNLCVDFRCTRCSMYQKKESLLHRLWFEIAPTVASHLTASGISDNGKWVALADLESVKLFKIDTTSGKPRVRKVKPEGYATPLLPEGVGATTILFTPNSGRMIVAGCDATVVVADLREDSVDVVKRFRFHCGDEDNEDDGVKSAFRGRKRWEPVCTLAVSSDGQWLASGDKANRIYIYNLDALKLHATIPRYPTPHTSVAFHPVSPTLIVTLHSNEFFLFDVETTDRSSVLSASTDSVPQCRLTDWSREYSHRLPRRLISKTELARGVAIPPGRNDMLILWASSWMCIVDLKRRKTSRPRGKVNGFTVHRYEDEDDEDSPLKFVDRFAPIMGLGFIAGADEEGSVSMVAVERPVLEVVKKLPASFYRHKYGT